VRLKLSPKTAIKNNNDSCQKLTSSEIPGEHRPRFALQSRRLVERRGSGTLPVWEVPYWLFIDPKPTWRALRAALAEPQMDLTQINEPLGQLP